MALLLGFVLVAGLGIAHPYSPENESQGTGPSTIPLSRTGSTESERLLRDDGWDGSLRDGMGDMMWPMGLVGLLGLLAMIVLVLAIAALVKYVFFR